MSLTALPRARSLRRIRRHAAGAAASRSRSFPRWGYPVLGGALLVGFRTGVITIRANAGCDPDVIERLNAVQDEVAAVWDMLAIACGLAGTDLPGRAGADVPGRPGLTLHEGGRNAGLAAA